mmetsp:Transcript_8744/g.25141  ORF Transcript_8744/g.25141 Transcript_8744/m.25141 type:complete len:255 (-) Transcript_8744:2274-3038(-)
MHPRRPHHGVPVRAAVPGPARRRPVRPKDRGRLRGQALRHRPGSRARARLLGDAARPHQRLQPVRGGQRGRRPFGDCGGLWQGRHEDLGRRAAKAVGGAQRVHRVGTGLHPRLPGQVHARGRTRGGGHHRARDASPEAFQLCRRHERGQGHPELHGIDGQLQQRRHPRPHPQARAAPRDAPQQRAGDPVRCLAKHQPHRAKASAHPRERNQGLLLQVQRPDLRQDGKARDHHQARQRTQHRPGALGDEGVRHRG